MKVSFVMSVLVSNAFCERIFSLLRHVLTDDKNTLSVNLIKSELKTKVNFRIPSSEIIKYLKNYAYLVSEAKIQHDYKCEKS